MVESKPKVSIDEQTEVMKITVDQALKNAIEAHKAGRFREADQFYTAILQAEPRHLDANHNLGVLAVHVGEVEKSLKYFRRALEVNSNVTQFWLSYLDALIKLNKITDAKLVFARAKAKGISGNALNKIEVKLENSVESEATISPYKNDVPAKSTAKNKKMVRISSEVSTSENISTNSQNKLAQLTNEKQKKNSETILNHERPKNLPNKGKLKNNLPENQTKYLIELYNEKKFKEILNSSKKLLKKFPNSSTLYNILGAANRQLGYLDFALKCYKTAIKLNPNNAELYNNIGVAYSKSKLHSFAINSYKKALKLKPNYSQAYINMGVELVEKGNLDAAIKYYKKALSLAPNHSEAYNNLGIAYNWLGNYEAAHEACSRALRINPSYAEARYNLGLILSNRGEKEAAIENYNQAILIDPNFARPQNNLGLIYKNTGDLTCAFKCFKEAIRINPEYAEAHYNLGNAFNQAGEQDSAIASFKEAIRINPEYAEAYYNVANIYIVQGDHIAAIKNYRKAIKIKPDYVIALNNLGLAFYDHGNLAAAVQKYRAAIKIDPEFAEAHHNLGVVLTDQGKHEAAIDSYKKTLKIKPNHASTHLNISALKKYKRRDKHFMQMINILGQEDMSDEERCWLYFALSKASEDLEDFASCFKFLEKGNRLRKEILEYDISKDIKLFQNIKISSSQISENAAKLTTNFANQKPIFILGMPRSGTTLIEQIVSSHTEVTGAGELPYVQKFGSSLAQGLCTPSTEALLEFRNKYLLELKQKSQQKIYVIDKMPQNFLYIGLICSVIPEAKIIHVKRDPAATCWSNYKQYFPSNDLGYCYDLTDIITYYGLYTDLMKFWYKLYKNRFYTFDYENLLINQEKETRQLIEYLQIPWQDKCLSPQKNDRNVSTASHLQIRQKIYKGSSNKWHNFKPFLHGIFDSL